MADTYDLAWLQNWASTQTYSDSGSASWAVISQVIPNFPNHSVTLGATDDGRYQIILTGDQVDGTPVYINPPA
jgi:hypothetical protein